MDEAGLVELDLRVDSIEARDRVGLDLRVDSFDKDGCIVLDLRVADIEEDRVLLDLRVGHGDAEAPVELEL